MRRSPLLLAIAPAVAFVAAGARWLIQGSGNLYTATSKRFYTPDPDLGWRVAKGGPVWLGLEVVAMLAAVALGTVAVAWLLRRWERRRGAAVGWARAVVGVGAALPLVIPVWAFASGLGPSGGRESLPAGATAAAPTEGIEGRLPAPAGRYVVVDHDGTAITARVSAGKETFDARLGRGFDGAWDGDPGDLTRPMTAAISVDASSVDTGVDMRSDHAREKYLAVGKHPRIGLTIDRLIAARQDGPALVAFRAAATLDFLGDKLPVEVTGNLRAADEAARGRLGFNAADSVLLVNADLGITVSGTALRSSVSSFDADAIPITVSLVLVRKP